MLSYCYEKEMKLKEGWTFKHNFRIALFAIIVSSLFLPLDTPAAKSGLDIPVRKYDTNTYVLSEPCLEVEGERYSFEFVLDSSHGETAFRVLEQSAQVLEGSECSYLTPFSDNPNYFHYKITSLVVADGNLDTGLRYDLDTRFESKSLKSNFVVTGATISEQRLDSNLFVTEPPEGYALELNNIGSYNSSEGRIFTCLSPYTDGVLVPISGITEFGISFSIVSVSDAIIGVADSTSFNTNNLTGSDGKRLSCSGSYETTTGIYQDIVLVGADLLRVSFQLLDPTLLTFKLAAAETLEKTPSLYAASFSPAKNSKEMPVDNNIVITFSENISRGSGRIELVDSLDEVVETFDITQSDRLIFSGKQLTINPTSILSSNSEYSVTVPSGAVSSTSSGSSSAVNNYSFRTQTDIAFLLVGYNNSTFYETNDAFKTNADKALSFLNTLSFNQISSYETHQLPTLSMSGEYAKSLGDLEVVNSALNNWGVDELKNYFREYIGNPNALQNPTSEQIEVLEDLKQWLLTNRKGASGWQETELGALHYSSWVSEKVLRWSRPIYFLLDALRLPQSFDPNEYKVISFILSNTEAINLSAAASNFNGLGGDQWSIKDFNGNKLTHNQDFFYSDHSDLAGDSSNEQLLNMNSRVDVHEAIHTWGQYGHDQDPQCIGYSTMSQCGGDADLQLLRTPSYPIYNRIYLMGWLPESVITSDPALIKDSYNATRTDQKYLLKVGRFKYQELYQGKWYQYSAPSLQTQLDSCSSFGIVTAPTAANPEYDAGNLCIPLLKDKSCGTKTDIVGLPEQMWDFTQCDFIDIDSEITREIFLNYVGTDYSGAVDYSALVIEQTNDSLRINPQ